MSLKVTSTLHRLRAQARDFLQPLRAAGRSVSPESVVRSLPERWLEPAVRQHIVDMHVVRDASVERYPFPVDFSPAFRTEMHFARRHVYQLRDVSVNVKTGSCSAGSLYFQESYGSLRRCLLDKPFPVSNGCAVSDSRPKTCVNLSGYYHFLLEEVPRLLWALRRHSELELLVHRAAPGYVRQVLEKITGRAGFSGTVRDVDQDVLELPNYVFTQAEAYSGFVHVSDLALLRDEFLAASPVQGPAPRRKLYLTRKSASRALDNEAAIISSMLSRGFEICTLEELDFSEQVRLFQGAALVVAPHGAGLANLVWCHPGTRVVEIFSPCYFNDCYARLCCQLKLSYQPVWAEGPGWGELSLQTLARILPDAEAE